MIRAFFWSGRLDDRRWSVWKHVLRAYFGIGAVVCLIWTQVGISVEFNQWHESMYDALEKSTRDDVDLIWASIFDFISIAGKEIILYPCIGYLRNIYMLWWRDAITVNYIPRWQHTRTNVEGASQRLQEDPMMFADLAEDIGYEVISAGFTIVRFVPLLWGLGARIDLGPITWDGWLVMATLGINILGVAISYVVGYKLPGLEYQNQVAEARFRNRLVHAEDDRAHLHSGNGWEHDFDAVKRNYRRLYFHYGYFSVWSTFYDKKAMVLPYLFGPLVALGVITLGQMFQIVHAHGEVHRGFSVILRNWKRWTKLRSVIKRLSEFEQRLEPPPAGATAAAAAIDGEQVVSLADKLMERERLRAKEA